MRKKILIVDDSEIDRQILSNILSPDFDITETDSGYKALEKMMNRALRFDAVLLDVSMPILDGFSVMQIMQEKGIDSIPVILITSEATKENVLKAAGYNVTGFIRKPFESKLILKRIRALFLMQEELEGQEENRENNLEASLSYASGLVKLFKAYLKNHGWKDDSYVRQENLMSLLLKAYAAQGGSLAPDETQTVLIAKAAYLHDMGQMAVPDEILMKPNRTPDEERIYRTHTELGAKMAQLNTSPGCQFFVNICSEFCMNHHERSDGNGFPGQLQGKEISLYTRLCSLVERFDKMFSRRPEFEHHQFVFVLNELAVDKDFMDEDTKGLFSACEQDILSYYVSHYGKMVR